MITLVSESSTDEQEMNFDDESLFKLLKGQNLNSFSPARDDFQDLNYLIYLRNEPGRKIVSNDRQFKQHAEELSIQLFEN